MRSNRKERIKGKNYQASLFIKLMGATKRLYSKKQRKPESQKTKKGIIQKEGSSENRDPTTDLRVAAWEKLPDWLLIPQDRNRLRRYSSPEFQCHTCFSSHSFMSSHLVEAFNCWTSRSRRAIMSYTWLRRRNTSPVNIWWASTRRSRLGKISALVDEITTTKCDYCDQFLCQNSWSQYYDELLTNLWRNYYVTKWLLFCHNIVT